MATQPRRTLTRLAGDARGAEVAFAGLQKLEGYLRSQVGKAMQLRSVPQLRMLRDDGAARGGRVLSILDAALAERDFDAHNRAAQSEDEVELDGSSDGEPLQEYDSADDDIITVR